MTTACTDMWKILDILGLCQLVNRKQICDVYQFQ